LTSQEYFLERAKFMDIRKIFEYALQREFEGKNFFQQNAERLNHAAAVGAFQQLAAEEQKHIDFIQSMLNKMNEGKKLDASQGEAMQNAGFFSQRASSEFLDQTVIEAMVPDLPVLRTAYLIERDFAEFYQDAAEKAEGEAKRVLEMLSHWERGHESLFKELHDKAFELYAQMPWGG
jgi:rubrerythrin